MLFTLALMEHLNPKTTDALIATGQTDLLLSFFVNGLYSPEIGLFHDLPKIIASLQTSADSLSMAQAYDSHVLLPNISRISNILSRVFAAVRHPQSLVLGLDAYTHPFLLR
jgi:hypothetical protein